MTKDPDQKFLNSEFHKSIELVTKIENMFKEESVSYALATTTLATALSYYLSKQEDDKIDFFLKKLSETITNIKKDTP